MWKSLEIFRTYQVCPAGGLPVAFHEPTPGRDDQFDPTVRRRRDMTSSPPYLAASVPTFAVWSSPVQLESPFFQRGVLHSIARSDDTYTGSYWFFQTSFETTRSKSQSPKGLDMTGSPGPNLFAALLLVQQPFRIFVAALCRVVNHWWHRSARCKGGPTSM